MTKRVVGWIAPLLILCGTIMGLFSFSSPVFALECNNQKLVYDGWDDEKMYDEADLFADTVPLPWGTEVCYVESRKRWLTTWFYIKTPDQQFGWLDSSDLWPVSEFQERMATRHNTYIEEMQTLFSGLIRLEDQMLVYGDDALADTGSLMGLVETWDLGIVPEIALPSTTVGPIELSGSGKQSPPITLTAGLWTVEAEVKDNSMCIMGSCLDAHFAVTVESVNGGSDLLFIEMGDEFNASTTLRVREESTLGVEAGKSLVSVDTKGDWTLTFRKE